MSGGSSCSNWDLSLYEVHRKPHDLVTDESLIAASPRALHAELMCPICLDLMRNTQTTKECLHRFCQECIITALRSGNKECPTCRKKLVSKRSLRSDPNFDALIAKIYPNRDELLQQERLHPMRPSLHHTHKRKRKSDAVSETPPSSRASTPQIMTTPLATPIEKRPKLNATDADTESIADSEDSEACHTNIVSIPKLEFQLRPHPEDEDVSNLIIRNLCTTPVTTVAHLVKFLQLLEETSISSAKFKLSAVVEEEGEGSYVGLSQSVSLKEICEQYWSPGEKLKLYFSTDDTSNSQ